MNKRARVWPQRRRRESNLSQYRQHPLRLALLPEALQWRIARGPGGGVGVVQVDGAREKDPSGEVDRDFGHCDRVKGKMEGGEKALVRGENCGESWCVVLGGDPSTCNVGREALPCGV